METTVGVCDAQGENHRGGSTSVRSVGLARSRGNHEPTMNPSMRVSASAVASHPVQVELLWTLLPTAALKESRKSRKLNNLCPCMPRKGGVAHFGGVCASARPCPAPVPPSVKVKADVFSPVQKPHHRCNLNYTETSCRVFSRGWL